MKVEIVTEGKKKMLVITAPIADRPSASKSGKNLLLASTGGNLNTGVKMDGKDIILGLNAYVKA